MASPERKPLNELYYSLVSRPAELYDKKFEITKRLEFSTIRDRELTLQYFTQNLMRVNINSNKDEIERIGEETRKIKAHSSVSSDRLKSDNRVNADMLISSEISSGMYIEKFYSTNPGRAETIKQAVDELVVEGWKKDINRNVFAPDEEFLNSWSKEWKAKLSSA
jgi:hypothetical protein